MSAIAEITTPKEVLPRVRAPRFAIDETLPRAWLATSLPITRVVNALSLVFPEGERFFIRSVRHYADVVEARPALAARVRAFVGQEGRHGHEHDRMNRALAAQGYDIDAFLSVYHRVAYELVEPRVPPHVRLATTVALEHMTATLAEVALTMPVLRDADPEVREMLEWHAAEEIEHKSVAFDVLMEVDPSMRTRAAGFAMGLAVLTSAWLTGMAMLAADDRRLGAPAEPLDARAERRFLRTLGPVARFVASSLAEYARPDFHPDARDNYELAEAVFARLGARDSAGASVKASASAGAASTTTKRVA